MKYETALQKKTSAKSRWTAAQSAKHCRNAFNLTFTIAIALALRHSLFIFPTANAPATPLFRHSSLSLSSLSMQNGRGQSRSRRSWRHMRHMTTGYNSCP